VLKKTAYRTGNIKSFAHFILPSFKTNEQKAVCDGCQVC